MAVDTGARSETRVASAGLLRVRHVQALSKIALGSTLLSVLTFTYADPDLWGHVRFGRDMIVAHAVRLPDRYSFASDVPWINHEWLSEVLMAGAYAAFGGVGLVLLKVAVLLAMVAAIATTLRRAGLSRTTRDALLAVAVVATIPQAILVRPQLFSLALFAWLLAALLRMRDGRWALLPIPILLLWANLHGGWIVGAGTLVLWASAGLFSAQPLQRRMTMCGICAVALLATAINPYGVRLWTFLRGTVGFGRPDIADWQPMVNTARIYVVLWLAVAGLLAFTAAVGIKRRTLDVPSLAVSLILGIAAYRVSRLQSFFAISVVMLMGRQLEPACRQSDADADGRGEAASPIGWRVGVAALVFLAVVGVTATAAGRNAGCIRIAASEFPEPAVADFVARTGIRGRMLTWFGWGEYAIWMWGERGISVSMDGRRETVYSDAMVNDHLRFYFEPGDRGRIVAMLNPDYVWLPTELGAVAWLTAHGWHPLFSGRMSTLLTRRAGERFDPATLSPRDGAVAARCFPGP